MKKALAVVVVAILSLSFAIPMKKTHALEKIDPEIVKMGLNSKSVIPVFVELEGRTVVDTLTFDGKKSFSAFEIMRPDNRMSILSASKLKFVQKASMKAAMNMVQGIKIGMSYQYVFNGFYAELPVDQVIKIADMPNVKQVSYPPPQYLDRTRSRVFLGAEKTWNTVVDPQGRAVNGNGILCGVTDSGLDYTHVDFGAQTKPVGPKVIISRDLAYKDNDCQEEEDQRTGGHGTSCAGIVAGDGPTNPKTKVKELGIAPKAKLAAFKVGMKPNEPFTLSSEGIMASWEYNVKDKVQVSNNSYGAPGGISFAERVQDRAVLAGVSVVASQGNEGSPGQYIPVTSGTTASPLNVIAVGALDDTDAARVNILNSPDENINSKNNLGYLGDNGKRFPSSSKQVMTVVDCGWGRVDDLKGLNLKGKLALIQRGPNPATDAQYGPPITFKEKCINAANAGAKAVLMYNYNSERIRAAYYEAAKNETPDMFNFVPSIELFDYTVGLALRDALHKNKKWTLGTPTDDQNEFAVSIEMSILGNLASFTSSGPNLRGYLKPDVSAPGVSIHTTQASFIEKGANNTYTEQFGGTSAAGPFVAGCAALVRQARPNWDPFEVKRALMNTAEPLKRLSNDYYLPMTSQGMGRVNANLAATTPILFNPPSALILTDSGKINITDPPSELFDNEQAANLPNDVTASKIPVKVTNYSNKPVKVSLSFEVNSARPEQFNVDLTTTELTIPPMSKTGIPGVAWFGLSIDILPEKVKGLLNDIYIWATEKATNRKWHIGVCVYNKNPMVQGLFNTYIGYVDYENTEFTPNGDGENDELVVRYEVTNGSVEAAAYYSNFLLNLRIWAIDQNSEKWVLIHVEPFLELGPHSFTWNGKDTNGNYILPDGDWSLSMACDAMLIDTAARRYVMVSDWDGAIFDLPDTDFVVSKSTVPSLPTLWAYTTPMEPGIGQTFSVGVYVRNAKNVKSTQFKIKMPGSAEVAQYMGYEKGNFITKDDPLTLFTVEYNKDKELIEVNVQRPLDGVSGEGWILYLKFLAKDMNFFDIQFSEVSMSMVDETMKEVKTKVFYKNAEISIFKDAFDPSDFNHDLKVNEEDLKILLACMDSVDGDGRYNWRCDLNFDMAINIEDYAIFSKSYSRR